MQNQYLIKGILYMDRPHSKVYMVHSITPFISGDDRQLLYKADFDKPSPTVQAKGVELKQLQRVYDLHDTFYVEYRKEKNFTPVIIGIVVNFDEVNLFRGEHAIFEIFNFRSNGSKW